MPTALDLQTKYPILATESEARIQLFINDAYNELDPDYFGASYERAVELRAMCMLVNSTPSLRAIVGSDSESISAQGRSRSVGYSKPGSQRGLDGSNVFCAQFAEMRDRSYILGFVE